MKNRTRYHVKYTLFLTDSNETIFLDRFTKNAQISYFIKLRTLGAELFHAGVRTDIETKKLTAAFRNIANAPKNYI